MFDTTVPNLSCSDSLQATSAALEKAGCMKKYITGLLLLAFVVPSWQHRKILIINNREHQ
jgi:hypothetical protein